MSLVELVHPQGSHQVSVVPLLNKCYLFKNNLALAIAPYRLQSEVSLEAFRDFVSALEDKPINIKDRNFPGLSQLSEEFGFQSLSKKLSAHRSRRDCLLRRQLSVCHPFQSWKSWLLKEFLSTSSRLLSTTKCLQLQLLRQCYYRLQLENNFKSTLVQEDLTFALQESTQLTVLLFKISPFREGSYSSKVTSEIIHSTQPATFECRL
jgi:hypothetical protein